MRKEEQLSADGLLQEAKTSLQAFLEDQDKWQQTPCRRWKKAKEPPAEMTQQEWDELRIWK